MFVSFAPMRFSIARYCILLLTVVCGLWTQAQNPEFRAWREDSACVRWTDSVYNVLSMEERIGQFFMLPAYTQGRDYNMDTVMSLLKQGKAGGVIFFRGMPEM